MDDIATAGGTACALAGDVAEEAEVVRVFEAVEERLGSPSALVNSAGISPGQRETAAALSRILRRPGQSPQTRTIKIIPQSNR